MMIRYILVLCSVFVLLVAPFGVLENHALGQGESGFDEAKFLAIGGVTGEGVEFYNRTSTDEFVKMGVPPASDQLSGAVDTIRFMPSGLRVAAGDTMGEIVIYNLTGNEFVLSARPDLGILGESPVSEIDFSPEGDIMYVGHGNEAKGFFSILQATGDGNFTEISGPDVGPDRRSRVAAHPGGEFVVVKEMTSFGSNEDVAVILYKWIEGTLTKLESIMLPSGFGRVEWSPDGSMLAVSTPRAPGQHVFKLIGDSLEKIFEKDVRAPSAVSWGKNGLNLVFIRSSVDSTRGIDYYSVRGEEFDLLNREAPFIPTGSDSLSFSQGMRSFLVARGPDSVPWVFDNSGLSLIGVRGLVESDIGTLFASDWSPGFSAVPVSPPGQEDFENQDGGLFPLSNWYRLAVQDFEVCGVGNSPVSGSYRVDPGGVSGSSQFYNASRPSGQGHCSTFIFTTGVDICDVGGVGFNFRWSGDIGGNYPTEAGNKRLVWSLADGFLSVPEVGVVVGSGGQVFLEVGTDSLAGTESGQSRSFIFTGEENVWYRAEFEIDCVTGVFDLEVEGQGSASISLPGMVPMELTNFRVWTGGDTSGANDQGLDNFGVELVDPTLGEPAEFSSGIKAFAQSFGFQTAESLFFFSLILVGLTLAIVGMGTQLLGDSRLRAMIVWFSAMGVGVFCVLVLELEFWMFVIAIVLGGAVVAGTGPLGGLVRGVGAPRPMAASAGAVTEQQVADEIQEMDQEIEDAALDDERAELQAEQTEGQVIEEIEPDQEKREED